MSLSEFRRRDAGRRGRAEIFALSSVAVGSVAPAYASEVSMDIERAVVESGTTWRLEQGITGDVGVGLGWGVHRVLSLRVTGGLTVGEANYWQRAQADGAMDVWSNSGAIDLGPRPFATIGTAASFAPMKRFHGLALMEARGGWVPDVPEEIEPLGGIRGGPVWGFQVSGGLAHESRAGGEIRALLGLGAWADGELIDSGDGGPAEWAEPWPMYASASLEFALTGNLVRERKGEVSE